MTQPWPYPVNSIGLLTGMEGLAYPEVVTSPATYTQYSTDLLDYSINWADFLMAGDAIATSEWTADTGLVLGATAFTAASTTVWVTSGSAGHTYRAVNTVTTRGGRDATRVLKFRIKQLNPTGPYFAVAGYLVGGGRLSATAHFRNLVGGGLVSAIAGMYSIDAHAALPGAGIVTGS